MGAVTGDAILQSVHDRERTLFARYALFSRDSRGRRYPEAEHQYRGPFQRDRDRILHSAAYRRLSGKTQVFTGMGDYHRTRLTHTQEVASIARTMGRTLRLNEDLIEALALFHDIGHPPFGHAGEDALDECLADHGGFSHNRHALTIAEELERRYPLFPGLNLTFEVLEGQKTRVDKEQGGASFEAQVVEAADSMTYDAHDTDDAVKLGLVDLEEFSAIPLIRQTMRTVDAKFAALSGPEQRKAIVHELIDCQVSSMLEYSAGMLAEFAPQSSRDAYRMSAQMGPTPEMREQKKELEEFLYERVYRHPDLVARRHQAQQRLREFFDFLLADPQRLPPRYAARVERCGAAQAVADYLAGMTDHYFDEQYRRLVDG